MNEPAAFTDTIITPARVRVDGRFGWAMRRVWWAGKATGYQVKPDGETRPVFVPDRMIEFADELTIPDLNALPQPLPSNVLPFVRPLRPIPNTQPDGADL